MALTEVQTKSKQSGGGGALGSIIGGALGLGASLLTGGAALPAALGAMGAGAGIGGIAGSMIDPAKASQGKKIQTMQSAMDMMPEKQAADLAEASVLVDTLPAPDEEKSLLKTQFATALDALKKTGLANEKVYGTSYAPIGGKYGLG